MVTHLWNVPVVGLVEVVGHIRLSCLHGLLSSELIVHPADLRGWICRLECIFERVHVAFEVSIVVCPVAAVVLNDVSCTVVVRECRQRRRSACLSTGALA